MIPAVIVACSEEPLPEEVEAKIEISTSEITFSEEGGAMNSGVGGFNAPSREAIYFRIHKLAYGTDWEYDYEEFVKYDAVNRTAATKSYSPVPTYEIPGAPIRTGISWKEAMK